jgi:V/A-type H+-transporting ATPase subunit E
VATIEERFQMIQRSVMDQATAEAQKLLDQAKEYKENAMKKAEDEVLQELYGKIQDEVAEIHTSATRSVSQKESQERQDLLLRREEITKIVFDQVKRRLLDFTKTPAYVDLMEELSKELGARCPLEGTVVMIRRDDYHLAARLGEYFGKNCRILADESIRIGGLKVMNQSSGIFMDETLDSRLEDQKPWFYSHSGLTVT